MLFFGSFFTTCDFVKHFFTVKGGQGELFFKKNYCLTGKGRTYTYDPGIMSVMALAEEGGKGLIGFSENGFFIVERVGFFF